MCIQIQEINIRVRCWPCGYIYILATLKFIDDTIIPWFRMKFNDRPACSMKPTISIIFFLHSLVISFKRIKFSAFLLRRTYFSTQHTDKYGYYALTQKIVFLNSRGVLRKKKEAYLRGYVHIFKKVEQY